MVGYWVLSGCFQPQIPCVVEGWECIQGSIAVFSLFPASVGVCLQPLVVMRPQTGQVLVSLTCQWLSVGSARIRLVAFGLNHYHTTE